MAHRYNQQYVTDEDRRELLKALGVAGTVAAGGATLGEIRNQMDQAATAELAPIGEAIRSDLVGQIDASLISAQEAELASAASGVSAVLDSGIREEPGTEFAAVAEAGRPLYDHFGEVGFFESTTSNLPEITPSYLNDAISATVGAKVVQDSLEQMEFVGGRPVDVMATVVGNAQLLSASNWAAAEEIPRAELEYGEYVPSMTKAAAGGALLWLEDIDQHLWKQEVLITDDILGDAVWHSQALAAGIQLMATGAKVIAEESGEVGDAELAGMLSTGFAVQALVQELLPADVYWITEEMRDSRQTNIGQKTT